ncbi:MAG TPA: hypothetical protein VIG25_06185 [Pyrinomonadaceae bacterium]
MTRYITSMLVLAIVVVVCSLSLAATAQDSVTVLSGQDLTRIVPPGFYFQGLSAPTQMRNSAAARFGSSRYVISGLVDTSGYSSEVREKYQGFFITDSPISIGGTAVEVGAYGFGFSNDGNFKLLDLSGKDLISVSTTKDSALRRPRPLMMTRAGDRLRLYAGRDYVEIATR